MKILSSALLAAALVATSASCSHLPGGHGLPGGGGGASGEVDPNTCGNYSASDAGAKLKIFLQATKDLNDTTIETAKVVKQSCITMGNELGMAAGDLAGDDTGKICNAVIATYKNNLKVSLKGEAALKISYKPAVCTVDASASAHASAECSGNASGTAGTGGTGGQANGQCAASAGVEASIHATCTPAELKIEADAKMIVDASKAQMTIKAMQDGLPQLLSVAARIRPIKEAMTAWVASAKDLAEMGPRAAHSFGDQATCILGQAAAVANASTHIQANVSVSVNVSASASGSVGG
jgi:hypothetical protein